MTETKTTNITGDNIIALQDIKARDVIIGNKDDLKPEVKKAKEEIAEQIAELTQSVALLANEKEFTEKEDIEDDEFDGVDFTDLIEALEEGNCVLFIGPETALSEDQKSLHEIFNVRISDSKRTYDQQEGFFMPGSEIRLRNKSIKFYSGTDGDCFQPQNNAGRKLMKKIAQIPFKLIISLAPDDTLHQIFNKYNKKHKFPFYTGEKYDEEKDGLLEPPIIYNALGNAAKNGRYIYTHKQLNEYIKQSKEIKFPMKVEKIIEETTHYLFIGFNFNKWHYRLLLFELNLLPDREGFAFKTKPINPEYQTFIHEQFKINFVDTNFQDFTQKLLQRSKDEYLSKSLDKVFVENTLSEINKIRIKVVDNNKLEELTNLQEELKTIEKKVFQFQE